MKEKSRIGVSVTFLAAIVWLSCIGSVWVPIVLAGAILYLEKDAWLRKQMIQLLVVFITLRTFNYILFEHCINEILCVNTDAEFVSKVETFKGVWSIVQDILYAFCAIKAWDHQDIGLLGLEWTSHAVMDNGANSVGEAGVCPHCGKSVTGDMGFCIYCGKKL